MNTDTQSRAHTNEVKWKKETKRERGSLDHDSCV